MSNKCNQISNQSQNLIAGLISQDNSVEFFGIRKTKEVRFIQNGQVKLFNELPPEYYDLLQKAYKKDMFAYRYLRKQYRGDSVKQVEMYTYYCYGALDHTPDIIEGFLQPAENFRDKINCVSLKFESKQITIDNKPLSQEDLEIIDLVAQDFPDKTIADHLGIPLPTLNSRKKSLFKKTNVQTKTALLKKAMQENIPVI